MVVIKRSVQEVEEEIKKTFPKNKLLYVYFGSEWKWITNAGGSREVTKVIKSEGEVKRITYVTKIPSPNIGFDPEWSKFLLLSSKPFRVRYFRGGWSYYNGTVESTGCEEYEEDAKLMTINEILRGIEDP